MILSYDPTFDMGYSSFFREYGNVKYDIVNSSLEYLLKVYDNENSGHGVYQHLYIDLDCGNEGDRFLVKGRFQLKDTSDNLIECDPKLSDGVKECSNIRAAGYSIENDATYPKVAETVAIHPDEYVNSGGWSLMTGIYTFGIIESKHTRLFLYLEGPHKDNTIIYADIIMVPLTKSCEQVIVNPSFEDGTSSFWRPNAMIDVDIYLNKFAAATLGDDVCGHHFDGSEANVCTFMSNKANHAIFDNGYPTDFPVFGTS